MWSIVPRSISPRRRSNGTEINLDSFAKHHSTRFTIALLNGRVSPTPQSNLDPLKGEKLPAIASSNKEPHPQTIHTNS